MRVDSGELQVAWESVREGGKAAGPDGQNLHGFRRHAAQELRRLERELRCDQWRHGAYRTVTVPRSAGGRRVLCIANVRDRVVQRLLLARLTPPLEEISLPASYAYRPGRSHTLALEAVADWRDRGFVHVLRGDVEECFDRMRAGLVGELLRELELDAELRELVLECVGAGRVGREPQEWGLPQGAVLSPALCNLVLTEVDRALASRHLRPIRYADDFAVLARSARGAELARRRAQYELWRLGLRLNESKTQVTDFAEGFRFLGAKFVRNYMVIEKRPRYALVYPRPAPRRRREGLGYLV